MTTCPQDIINRIWRLFVAQGIADEQQIIETVAYYLLERVGYTADTSKNNFLRAISLNNTRSESLQNLLDEALQLLPAHELLNHCLMFRLDTMQAGGRYPTPRHITYLMAELVRGLTWSDDMTVADFASGSGGLLVELPHADLTGMEISPSWARLARANLYLHQNSDGEIYTGDAFAVVDEQVEGLFDAILMNPPFGALLEKSLVEQRLGAGSSTRSETALTLLALNHLNYSGRLAVLHPSSTLVSNGKGEKNLRERLLAQICLDAVIQLPKDAFQPYSQLQTYLLLAHNSTKSSLEVDAPVWFYQINHDGFSTGRNRQPQPEQSQLPQLVAAARAAQNSLEWEIKDEHDAIQLAVDTLSGDGVLITQPTDGKLSVQAIALSKTIALWLTRQTEISCEVLVYEGVAWSQQSMPSEINSLPLQPLTFQIDDDSGRAVTLKKNKKTWQLGLKSANSIVISENWQPGNGFLAFIAAEDGTPLSPLLYLTDLDKDDKPKPLSIWPLADADGQAAGSLLLWDVTAITPLCFGMEDGGTNWLLLPGTEEAALIGLETGEVKRVQAGRMKQAFVGESWHRGVVLDGNGVRFGVGVSPKYIIDNQDYDLTFDRYYLPDSENETAGQLSAAELLATMRQKQQAFAGRLDYLLGIIEMRPSRALPPPIVDVMPFNPLNRSQNLVWQRILTMRERVDDVETGRPFRAEDLGAGLNIAEVEQALAMFERMGVIVPVVIDDAPYYRPVTERDMVSA